MKLSLFLLAELAEAGRDWSLVNNPIVRNLVIKGGSKIPRGFNNHKLREQSRNFPYCTAGSPAEDDCFRRCQGWPGSQSSGIMNCDSTQELFTVDQTAYRKCRQKSHVTQKENCYKISNVNDLVEQRIDFDGEELGFYTHHTTEIEAPFGKFIEINVQDFSIGERQIPNNPEELCGYGSIYFFSGAGPMSSMQKIIEFCGTKDSPVVDEKDPLYTDETPELAKPVTIKNNRVIIGITTQERFNLETIAKAKATITWKIVDAPHNELILQPEYFQQELVRKFRQAMCADLSDFVLTNENDVCTFEVTKKTKWLNRLAKRFIVMMLDVQYKNHINCFQDGDAFKFEENDMTIKRMNSLVNMNDAFVVGKSYLQQVGRQCQFAIFWDKKIDKIRAKFERGVTKIPPCTMGTSLCEVGNIVR